MFKKFLLFLVILLASSVARCQTESDSVVVWSITPGGISEINSIDVSPDGSFFATASNDGFISVYNTSDGSYITEFKSEEVSSNSVRFSFDGKYIVTCGCRDTLIKVWNTNNWTLNKSIKIDYGCPYYASFSHNNKYIAVARHEANFQIWDLEKGELFKTIETDQVSKSDYGQPMTIDFSPNDSLLSLSASFNNGKVYDFYHDATILNSIPECIFSMFSRDGKKFIAEYDYDHFNENKGIGVCIYDLQSKILLGNMPLNKGIKDADVSYDNNYLAYGLENLYIYDLSSNIVVSELPYSSYMVKFITNSNDILIATPFGISKLSFNQITGVHYNGYNSANRIIQIYPNPGNSIVTIKYQIDEPQNVKVIIEDISGNEISKLFDSMSDSGTHDLTWDNSGIANGIYFVKLVLENSFDTQKFVVNK